MQAKREYVIQFVSLGLGVHEYEFSVQDSFFNDFEYSEVKQGNVQVQVQLLKQSHMMVLEFEISGTVKVPCDLCAAEFDLPIEGSYKLIVKVGGTDVGEDNDDIITIAANEHELDLSQYIYEYIILSIPSKRVHPLDENGESTCDKEVLKKLKGFLVEEEKVDPRWAALKNIKLN
jgi:uncharacterized metal-binding protein YceD (DUF177 family)